MVTILPDRYPLCRMYHAVATMAFVSSEAKGTYTIIWYVCPECRRKNRMVYSERGQVVPPIEYYRVPGL